MEEKNKGSVFAYDKSSDYFVLKTPNGGIYYITPNDQINPINQGNFGVVFKAVNYQGKLCAVKKMAYNEQLKERIIFEQELMIKMKTISCGHTIYAFDVAQEGTDIYIAMPLYDGTLTQIINQHHLKSEEDVIEAFRQICYGLKCLHQENIIHRDLKTDNILFKKTKSKFFNTPFIFCLADYGISKTHSDEMNNTMNVGTSYTKAPEVSTGKYGIQADIFSLGCILYKMFTGKEPFSGSSEQEIYKNKIAKKYSGMTFNGKEISEFSKNLISKCLEPDLSKRISPVELYNLLKVEKLHYTSLKLNKPLKRADVKPIIEPYLKRISLLEGLVKQYKQAFDYAILEIPLLENKINSIGQLCHSSLQETKAKRDKIFDNMVHICDASKAVLSNVVTLKGSKCYSEKVKEASVIDVITRSKLYLNEKSFMEGEVHKASNADSFNEQYRRPEYCVLNDKNLCFISCVPLEDITDMHSFANSREFWYNTKKDKYYLGRNFKLATDDIFYTWRNKITEVFNAKRINLIEEKPAK